MADFLTSLTALVTADEPLTRPHGEQALYLRPFMFASEVPGSPPRMSWTTT